MKVKDLLNVIYGQQQIVIYEKLNSKYALFDGIAYNVDSYDNVRQRDVSYVYSVISNGDAVVMIEVK